MEKDTGMSLSLFSDNFIKWIFYLNGFDCIFMDRNGKYNLRDASMQQPKQILSR